MHPLDSLSTELKPNSLKNHYVSVILLELFSIGNIFFHFLVIFSVTSKLMVKTGAIIGEV